jgi:hypothetical protein
VAIDGLMPRNYTDITYLSGLAIFLPQVDSPGILLGYIPSYDVLYAYNFRSSGL